MASSGTSSVNKRKHARNDLPLKLKYEVIQTFERERGKIGVRKLAEIFKCGKTQISKTKSRLKKLMSLTHEVMCAKFGKEIEHPNTRT